MAVVKIKMGSKATDAVKVWQTDTGKELVTQPVPDGFNVKTSFSPNGQRFAVTAPKGKEQFEVMVRDTGTGQKLATITLPPGEGAMFAKITFDADGKRIALPVVRSRNSSK